MDDDDDFKPTLADLLSLNTELPIRSMQPTSGGLFGAPMPVGGGRKPVVKRGQQYPLPLNLPVQRRGVTAYHGSTQRDLKELSSKHAVETPGTTWHSSEPDVASTFTVPREYGEPVWTAKPGNVYEVNIAAKNPLELRGIEAQRFSDYNTKSVIDDARRRAHDLIIARGVNEGIGNSQRSDVYAVLDDSIAKLLGKLKW